MHELKCMDLIFQLLITVIVLHKNAKNGKTLA
jgi:hypothetical protein